MSDDIFDEISQHARDMNAVDRLLGFWRTLSPQEQAAALAYRGEENILPANTDRGETAKERK